jgi:hypothetical protein
MRISNAFWQTTISSALGLDARAAGRRARGTPLLTGVGKVFIRV